MRRPGGLILLREVSCLGKGDSGGNCCLDTLELSSVHTIGSCLPFSFYRNVRDTLECKRFPWNISRQRLYVPPPGESPEAPGLLTFDVKQVTLLRAPFLAEEPETLLGLAMVILKFLFMQHILTYPDQSTSYENQPSFAFYGDFPQGHSGLKPRGLPREESGNG